MPKALTSYTSATKPTTGYADTSKNSTSFIGSSATGGVQLDSSTVTLGSLLIYLNGYTTSTTPNENSTKLATTYLET